MELEEKEISLNEIVSVLIKRWKLIVVPSIIAALISAIYVLSLPKVYESYALLKLGNIGEKQIETVASIKEVMSSLPIRIEIVSRLKDNNDSKFVESLKDAIIYEDASGFLRIKANGKNPEKAAELVKVTTDIIYSRHQSFYEYAQKELYSTVERIRDFACPIPLTTGIAEFKIEPTRVEIPAIINPTPVGEKKKIVVLTTFFSVLFLNILIAFYLEGRKK